MKSKLHVVAVGGVDATGLSADDLGQVGLLHGLRTLELRGQMPFPVAGREHERDGFLTQGARHGVALLATQVDVENGSGRGIGIHERQRIDQVRHHGDPVAEVFQQVPEHHAEEDLVFDDENVRLRGHGGVVASGISITHTTPVGA